MTRGDPESPLRWVCKSTRKLSKELTQKGYKISHSLVARLLKEMDYSLQANKKTREGAKKHADRNAQFHYINGKTKQFQKQNQPVIRAGIIICSILVRPRCAGRKSGISGSNMSGLNGSGK